MTEYYDAMDNAELKRVHEHAKLRLNEIKEHGGQVLQDFLAHYKLEPLGAVADEQWEKNAIAAAE
jgi:hypothetical protein